MATEAGTPLSASVADTGADVGRSTNEANVDGQVATGTAGPLITPVLVIARSSMPTHSSLPGASVVRMRTWTTGRGPSASPGERHVDGGRHGGPGGRGVGDESIRHVGVVAAGADAELQGQWLDATSDALSMSRATKWTRMPVTPVVLNVATRWGASAVPEPCSATTGSVIRNSATPPALNVSGFVWLAFTSTTAVCPREHRQRVDTCRCRHVVAAVADEAGHGRPVVSQPGWLRRWTSSASAAAAAGSVSGCGGWSRRRDQRARDDEQAGAGCGPIDVLRPPWHHLVTMFADDRQRGARPLVRIGVNRT